MKLSATVGRPQLALWTAVAGTVFIAILAFSLSFRTLTDLARRSGIAGGQAWMWPLIVDGIIVVATVSVVALAGHKTSWYPWLLLAAGAAVSVTANAVHALVAADPDVPRVLAASVAAVPPLVLLAITHLTVVLTRRAKAELPLPAQRDQFDETRETETSAPEAAREPRELALLMREQGASNKAIASSIGVHPSTVGRWFAACAEIESPPASE